MFRSLILICLFFVHINSAPMNKKYDELCICVPFWQCNAKYSGINTEIDNGWDGMDIRQNDRKLRSQSKCKYLDVCCPIQCGQRKNVLTTKILNGKKTKFAEYPWMLGLIRKEYFCCGASLIHPKVALTAAHCITENNGYVLRAGEWDWESNNELLPHQDRNVAKVIKHEHFDPNNLLNDIALLITDKPFELDDNVGIICLPFPHRKYDGEKCIATGWGRNSHKSDLLEPVLRHVELPIVTRSDCEHSLRINALGNSFQLHKSFICAGGEKKKDTCKGDGGSPLVCPVSGEFNRYEQIGIVSWGLTCGLYPTPGVYVNVGLFSDWIDKQMMLHGFNPEIYKIQ